LVMSEASCSSGELQGTWVILDRTKRLYALGRATYLRRGAA
jgi:hypothetical protein